MAVKGNLDVFMDGCLEGWATISESDQRIRLRIDDSVEIPAVASRFRQDLQKAGLRSGFAAFKVAVPYRLLDDQEHLVELLAETSGEVICGSKMRLETPTYLRTLLESNLLIRGSIEQLDGKRIALFCGYDPTGKVSVNSAAIIRLLKEAGMAVVYILAVDRPSASPDDSDSGADVTILRRNGGYDFASWAAGLIHLTTSGKGTPESILLINDSMLWTGHPLDQRFLSLRSDEKDWDVLGATDSYQRKYHLQSYFLLFSSRVVERGFLDEFLLYQGDYLSDKEQVINKFELSTYKFFSVRGMAVRAAVKYEDAIGELWPELLTYLKNSQEKFAPAFLAQLGGCHEVVNWINVIRSGDPINPAQACWSQLCRSGFPFIKREIITRNPARVPFFERIRASFDDAGLPGLDELVKSDVEARIPSDVSMHILPSINTHKAQ